MKRVVLMIFLFSCLTVMVACGPGEMHLQAQERAVQARLDAKAVEADRLCPEEWQTAEEAMRLAVQWEERQDPEAAARFYRFSETAYRTAQRRAEQIQAKKN